MYLCKCKVFKCSLNFVILAFEQLEKAVAATQNTEEAQKMGKQRMDEQIIAIEKASEEERVNLQKELTRVKQEVVDIMKVWFLLWFP